MPKPFDRDFKLNAVQMVTQQCKVASQVARDLGISPKTKHGWVQHDKEDLVSPFVGSGHLKPDAQALRELERENRDLREENAILKRAMRINAFDRK